MKARKLVKLVDPLAKTDSLYICLNIENRDYGDFSTAVTRIQGFARTGNNSKTRGVEDRE